MVDWLLPLAALSLCFLAGSWCGYRLGVVRAALDLLPPGETYRAVGVQVTNCERLPDDGGDR